jgi:hypothetical protein
MGLDNHHHLFVVSTLGLGLAIAMLVDGIWGGTAPPPSPAAALPPPPPPSPPEKEETSAPPEALEGDYARLYQEKQRRERAKRERRRIKEINADAYTGDGSASSRRLYLMQQAYKRSRELTPVVAFTGYADSEGSSDEDEEDELVRIARSLPADDQKGKK